MSRQPLKDKLSQKLWSGLCFVAEAFALVIFWGQVLQFSVLRGVETRSHTAIMLFC